MFYKAKVAVCSEIRTKHINAIWALWRITECWTWWYVKLPLGFKTLSDKEAEMWLLYNNKRFQETRLSTANGSDFQS
jgi:hypothetical protein